MQVPVFFGDSLSVDVDLEQMIDVKEAQHLLSDVPSCDPIESQRIPTVESVAGQDRLQIGRVRQSTLYGTDLSFWLVGDRTQFGAFVVADLLERLISDFTE